jgi:hypothetical protein
VSRLVALRMGSSLYSHANGTTWDQVDVGISIVAQNARPYLAVVRCDALIGDLKVVLGGGATYARFTHMKIHFFFLKCL